MTDKEDERRAKRLQEVIALSPDEITKLAVDTQTGDVVVRRVCTPIDATRVHLGLHDGEWVARVVSGDEVGDFTIREALPGELAEAMAKALEILHVQLQKQTLAT